MRLLLTFFLVFYLSSNYAQPPASGFSGNAGQALVAKNNKHTRRYKNGELLKIFYHDGNKISKAKGTLLINTDNQIFMLPFHKRDHIIINVNGITSIGLWKRSFKSASVILGGTGALTLGLLALANQPQRSGVDDGLNIIGFGLLGYSILILYYEMVAIPAIILGEHIGIRSEKKGYHFYIENN